MDQKPDFRLEPRGWISWFEVERYLTNDVVEIPWKREFDSVAAHSRNVGTLVPHRPTTCLGRCGLWLRDHLRLGRPRLRGGLGLSVRRSHTRGRLWRGLGRRQRHVLDR